MHITHAYIDTYTYKNDFHNNFSFILFKRYTY